MSWCALQSVTSVLSERESHCSPTPDRALLPQVSRPLSAYSAAAGDRTDTAPSALLPKYRAAVSAPSAAMSVVHDRAVCPECTARAVAIYRNALRSMQS